MATSSARNRTRASILDRLLAEPDAHGGTLMSVGSRELRRAIARDLEWLLNTQRALEGSLTDLPEAEASILGYGLPDFSSYSWDNPEHRSTLVARVREAVQRFEPRLNPRTVNVRILETTGIADFRLRFRIDALLEVETIREFVAFDADMSTTSSPIRVLEAT